MADLGVWFKLWCAALDDPALDNLDICDFGRWAKLGAFVKRHGDAGSVVLTPPSRAICSALQVPDFDALMSVFHRLPGVTVRRDTTPVPGETNATVSFSNWTKYQGDFSTYRTRKWRERERSRGEEKRGEEKRREKKRIPSLLPPAPGIEFKIPESIQAALAKCPRLLQTPRLTVPGYWQALIRANPGVDYGREVLKAEAWLAANPNRPRKDLGRFLANWINRAERDGEAS